VVDTTNWAHVAWVAERTDADETVVTLYTNGAVGSSLAFLDVIEDSRTTSHFVGVEFDSVNSAKAMH
jgi:hypothetical protein